MQYPLITLMAAALLHFAPVQRSLDLGSISVSVIDDATGAPIAGAKALAVDERTAPVWGESWVAAEALTNPKGQALLPGPRNTPQHDWIMVQAEGYGTAGTSSFGDRVEFRLQPETPITIEVLDFLGRPLPLAHLGVAFGCGHTPDLVTAVTGPAGRATLRGVTDYDGGIEDLYVVHPELSQPSYDTVPFNEVENGVARFYGEPGCMIAGCILLPSGEPAVGYSVGNNETHRGHWARTDERGEFRLFGCEPRTDYLSVITPGSDRKTFFNGAVEGVYRTLQLNGTDAPEERMDGQQDAMRPEATVRVQVNIPNPPGLYLPERLRWIPVVAWEVSSGLAKWNETGEDGSARLNLTVGNYLVQVGGPGSPYREVKAGELLITGEEGEIELALECDLPAPRVCSLEISGLGQDQGVALMTSGGFYTRYSPKGPEAQVPHFLLPSGLWSAYVTVKAPGGGWQRKYLDVPRNPGKHLSLTVPD